MSQSTPTEWLVLQVRPGGTPPQWWPKNGEGKAAWGTCYPDGSGYSMKLDPGCALPAEHVSELQQEWLDDHEGRAWEFRTLEGAAPAKKAKKKRAAR